VSAVPAVKPRSAQADAVSLLLAGALCLLPFLLPYREPPILSFHAEWLAAALGVAAMLTGLRGHKGAFAALPVLARWLIAFALFLAAQTLVGTPVYSQLPLMGTLYVLYAALLVWLGAQLAASAGLERAATVLAAFLVAGALANAAAGVIQFYGRPALLEDIVAALHHNPQHNGAYGNIGQANLYANYLALGGTALLFLWLRRRLRTPYALAAAALLACSCALSGSRSALLYAFWFALLGVFAGRMQAGVEARRLKFAAYGYAVAMLVAQLAIPWLNDTFHLGPANQGAIERMVDISGNHGEARWQAWLLALRIFADAPILGVGIGEFAGAVFDQGISPQMALGGVWTSPHNLPLQLLAETGALGAALALAGLAIWCWQAARRYFSAPEPAMWWIIAAIGIELIHSMFEFPLWSAHFLGVTALVMGLGTSPATNAPPASRLSLTVAGGLCAVIALALALVLRDYLRLDETHVTGTTLTLASTADASRDAAVMRAVARGPLAPTAELWIFLGAPLDRSDLASKLEMSARVARHFPSHAVIVRRAAFLALNGHAAAARSLLAHAMQSFPHRCKATLLILGQAPPSERIAIEPLLNLANAAREADCR